MSTIATKQDIKWGSPGILNLHDEFATSFGNNPIVAVEEHQFYLRLQWAIGLLPKGIHPWRKKDRRDDIQWDQQKRS